MKTIRTEITVDAPPEAVWAVLTDLESYREWNPQTTGASGEVVEGERVRIRVEPTGGRAATMRPLVLLADEPRRLEWVGKLPVPGLFRARHVFELEPLEERRTRVTNTEFLSGLLVRFVVNERAPGDYRAANRALKDRVESLQNESLPTQNVR